MNKLKVALVCSFSNAKVREHLPLVDRKLYNIIRRCFGLSTSSGCYGDVAGWDTYMIEQLRKRDDIDLTVISAHSGLKRLKCSFELEGVHYHFVKTEYATGLKHLIPSPALWHRLNPMRPIVRRLVKQTKPDVIALIGAENPHISGTVLGIDGIPLIVKCQTIYNNPERKAKTGVYDEKNAYVERLILENLKYVSVTTEMHERLFRKMNKTAINFKWSLGNLLPELKNVDKEYDFANFALHMIPSKGYTDVINAMAIVKSKNPNVKLNLIGSGTEEYRNELNNLIDKFRLKHNVVFTPFFERQEDLFQHLMKVRFAVLPCKLDYVASTIRQAMHYELPVVCYETKGTITLNQDKECVLIAENSNPTDLADKMIQLLSDKNLEARLRKNAKEYAARWSDDEKITGQMVANFKAVIDNYKNGTPVPSELLYNPEQ